MTGATGYSSSHFDAQAGGKVNLSNVTSQPSGRIYAHAQGTNSVIDLSKLPELYSDAEYDSDSRPATAARFSPAALTTLNRGDIQLDDNQSSITTSHITSITSSNLYCLRRRRPRFSGPYTFSEPSGATILANGAGSVLDLTSLTSLDGATGYSTLNIDAQAGGKVNLSNVTSQPSGRIYAHAEGTNSVIDFSKLPELYSDAEYDSELEASNGGSILAGGLTTLNRGDIQLDDNQSSITTSQITSITSSNLYCLRRRRPRFSGPDDVLRAQRRHDPGQRRRKRARPHQPDVADRRDRVLHASTSMPRPAARLISATSRASRAGESTPTPRGPIASSTYPSCPSSSPTPNTIQGSRPATAARSSPGTSPRSIAATFSLTTTSRRSPPARSRRSPRRISMSTAVATSRSRHLRNFPSQAVPRSRPTAREAYSTCPTSHR